MGCSKWDGQLSQVRDHHLLAAKDLMTKLKGAGHSPNA
jgi:hypothetical protein